MAKFATNVSAAILLPSSIQVTESISGSVVPLAMFNYGIALARHFRYHWHHYHHHKFHQCHQVGELTDKRCNPAIEKNENEVNGQITMVSTRELHD